MRRLISSINVTADGYCDHTLVIADRDLHQYALDLIESSGTVIFGRVTYQIFESYWPHVPANLDSPEDQVQFALKINPAPKIVFSKTLKHTGWKNVRIARDNLKTEIQRLKGEHGRDLLTFGSPSLVASLSNLHLIDEYHLLVQPIVAAAGRPLSQGLNSIFDLKLISMEQFSSGVVLHRYRPT